MSSNTPIRYDGGSMSIYVIGGIMSAAAIPIKIGFSKKIKKSIILMNEDAKNPKTTFIESSEIIANSNGIGISIKF